MGKQGVTGEFGGFGLKSLIQTNPRVEVEGPISTEIKFGLGGWRFVGPVGQTGG